MGYLSLTTCEKLALVTSKNLSTGTASSFPCKIHPREHQCEWSVCFRENLSSSAIGSRGQRGEERGEKTGDPTIPGDVPGVPVVPDMLRTGVLHTNMRAW